MFSSVLKDIDAIAEFGSSIVDRLKAKGVLDTIQIFNFCFYVALDESYSRDY
jgi:hypothetical protein